MTVFCRYHGVSVDQTKYLVCPKCSLFHHTSDVSPHENHLRNGRHHYCHLCQLCFDGHTPGLLEHHVHHQHSDVSDLRCGQCDLRFTSRDILR